MQEILLLAIFVSFASALIFLPKWINKCKRIGLLWEDMNKISKPKAASSGGIVVVMAFILGVLVYIEIRTFIIDLDNVNLRIFALLIVISILSIVGLIDDLLGWKHGGLSPKFRIFMALFASIPLVVINAGTHFINLPIIGEIQLGVLYPLLFIPIGI